MARKKKSLKKTKKLMGGGATSFKLAVTPQFGGRVTGTQEKCAKRCSVSELRSTKKCYMDFI